MSFGPNAAFELPQRGLTLLRPEHVHVAAPGGSAERSGLTTLTVFQIVHHMVNYYA